MEILEHFSCSKYGRDDLNEDQIVITPDFLAVIDGATDISGADINGMKPGRFASTTVAAAFENLDKNADALQITAFLTEAMSTARQKHNVPPDVCPFCVFACYSRAKRQIFRLKDIKIAINGAEMIGEIAVVEALVEARRAVLHGHLAAGRSVADLLANDPSRTVYNAFSAQNFSLLNNVGNTYGFGVIDGNTVPDKFIETIDVPDGAEVILASDGYPVLKNSLEESEAALADILAQDPLLIGDYPQPRALVTGGISFDDRSWLKFRT
ncbi:MAG: hypothetical protein EP349_03355 [Alphaproteobacteria bacterium]|nr:MAG: hypothetical protein EP349_03355 [Alphaproteobacteria bacterium]